MKPINKILIAVLLLGGLRFGLTGCVGVVGGGGYGGPWYHDGPWIDGGRGWGGVRGGVGIEVHPPGGRR